MTISINRLPVVCQALCCSIYKHDLKFLNERLIMPILQITKLSLREVGLPRIVLILAEPGFKPKTAWGQCLSHPASI